MPKMSKYPAISSPADTDEFVVNQGGVTKKVTLAQLRAAIGNATITEILPDDGVMSLPTVSANSSGHGIVQVSADGVIEQSAEFEVDSTGNAVVIRGTADVVVNADTDAKLCIGTAAAQNPLTVKNRLGGTKTVMVSFFYN